MRGTTQSFKFPDLQFPLPLGPQPSYATAKEKKVILSVENKMLLDLLTCFQMLAKLK